MTDTIVLALPEDDGKLIERLRELLAKATPELFTAKPHRIAQMLRDGAYAQRPQADNIATTGFADDGALIIEAINALPNLLTRIETLTREIERLQAGEDHEQSLDEISLPDPPRITIGKVMSDKALAELRERVRAETLEEVRQRIAAIPTPETFPANMAANYELGLGAAEDVLISLTTGSGAGHEGK